MKILTVLYPVSYRSYSQYSRNKKERAPVGVLGFLSSRKLLSTLSFFPLSCDATPENSNNRDFHYTSWFDESLLGLPSSKHIKSAGNETVMSALSSSLCRPESTGNLTASTSLLSLATALDSAQANEDLNDDAIMQHHSIRGGIMRVQTLSESLSSSELCRSMLKRRLQPSVSFDSIEIHEHAVILGCNPSVSAGPPLTISWESLSSSIQTVEHYERSRGTRRSALFLRKSKTERDTILKEEGFSSEELAVATSSADSIRQSREESAQEKSDLQALLKESQRRKEERRQQRKQGGLFGRWRNKTKAVTVR